MQEKIFLLGATSAICLISTGILAQTPSALEQAGIDLNNPEYEETVRRKYVNDASMPDYLAFPILLDAIADVNDKNPNAALNLIRSEMKLSLSETKHFLELILNERNGARNEVSAKTQEVLCASGIPRVSGPQVLEAMNVNVDEEERIGARRYTAFQSQLSETEVQQLGQWLDSLKTSTVHVTYDYAKHYPRIGGDPDELVALICGH